MLTVGQLSRPKAQKLSNHVVPWSENQEALWVLMKIQNSQTYPKSGDWGSGLYPLVLISQNLHQTSRQMYGLPGRGYPTNKAANVILE